MQNETITNLIDMLKREALDGRIGAESMPDLQAILWTVLDRYIEYSDFEAYQECRDILGSLEDHLNHVSDCIDEGKFYNAEFEIRSHGIDRDKAEADNDCAPLGSKK